MSLSHRRRPLSVLLALALAGAGATTVGGPASAATGGELLYGLTSDNRLVSFRADTPGTTLSEVAVTGLQAGEDLVGIDVRPATAELYAVGSTSRLYVVDPATGAATQRGAVLTPALSGTAFGVDVSPTVDRLRIVSNTGQNLQVDPATGAVVVDTPLAYAAGDAGAGTAPRVAAAGYTNSTSANGVGAGGTTALFDIDTARDVLAQQDPASAGTLTTVGALGVAVSDVATVGLDIAAADNTAFAALTPDGTTAPGLYRVSLTTGAATLLGALGSATVEDLTVASVAPADPCSVTPQVTLNPTTIAATESAAVTVTAPAGASVELFAYSRPATSYVMVRPATTVGPDGTARFTVRPPTNTRLYAQIVGCTTDATRFSVVLNVRTQLSLDVVRNGTRIYTFSGSAIPARPRGLIVTLYRVTPDGRQILAAQTRANANRGQEGYDASRPPGSYSIRRTFSGSGRFGFVVRTGQDLQNAPSSSNLRSLLVY